MMRELRAVPRLARAILCQIAMGSSILLLYFSFPKEIFSIITPTPAMLFTAFTAWNTTFYAARYTIAFSIRGFSHRRVIDGDWPRIP